MKVIFLDIDGVLINLASCRRGFGKVDPRCVALLNRLIKRTDAVIVLSSCWRIGLDVAECKKLLAGWHVHGKVIDRTEDLYNVHPDQRGAEIKKWLCSQDHENVESFVIIDDDSDMGDLMPYLVKTKFTEGLTKEKAEEAYVKLTRKENICQNKQLAVMESVSPVS